MALIRIDILSENEIFVLNGDIDKLLLNRSAKLYLKDYLRADFSVPNEIRIKYQLQNRDKIIQNIQILLRRFNFEEQLSEGVGKVLNDYLLEEKNFNAFSKQAFLIRNDNLSSKHIEEFKEFTNVLANKLPRRRLYPLQLLSAYHLAFSQNACNFSVPGAGKTSIVLAAYAYLKSLPKENPKSIERILVIGPLSSFDPWETEYCDCFGIRPTSKRLSGGISREDVMRYLYSSMPTEMTLISYQGVSKTIDDVSYFLKQFRTMVILDEAHKIKNVEGGQIANSVLAISKYCKSRVVLTGTPAPNGYEDIFNLFKFIWPQRNVVDFQPYQLQEMSINPNDDRIGQLINNISPYFMRIRKSDLNLPNPINHDPIIVKMGNIQKEIYNYIEREYMRYFVSQGNNSQMLKNILTKARMIRLMQASTNPALLRKPIDEFLGEEGVSNDLFFNDSNILEAIKRYDLSEVPPKFIEAANLIKNILAKDEKVIVWATFVKNIEDFSAYLKTVGIESRTLYGKTPIEQEDQDISLETRESIIREFHLKDSAFKVIVANPFAVSESISLHKACKNAIYIERSFNAAHFVQSKDRIHRYGLRPEDKVNYYYLLSENNMDLTIHQRLTEKEERMMAIIENEPIPLFSRIEASELDDIKILINNYVHGNPKV